MTNLNFDTFTCIANFVHNTDNSLPLACTSKELYCYWNNFVPRNSQLLSNYIQTLLEKNGDLNKITEQLQRFGDLAYTTPFALTLSHNQFSPGAVEAVAKKFPNLQTLTYLRPQELPASTATHSYKAMGTTPLTLSALAVLGTFSAVTSGASYILPSSDSLTSLHGKIENKLEQLVDSSVQLKCDLRNANYYTKFLK